MPMDGFTLGFEARELDALLRTGRVDKVTQPEKDTVILTIRADGTNRKLLLCASPNNARAHLTTESFSNPLEPPMFCMLLRKQLLNARLENVKQIGGDRILYLDFDAVDEMGDHVLRRLILEIMGRHSNLILTDGKRILDAARHVHEDMSRVRLVLPGLDYCPPPAQEKLGPDAWTADRIREAISAQGDIPLQKALCSTISGLSNVSAAELTCRMLPPGEDRTDRYDLLAEKLAAFLQHLPDMAQPHVLTDGSGHVTDAFPFAYISRDTAQQQPSPTLSEALEKYFGLRDQKDRLHQRSATMVRLLKGHIERCEKKLALQEEELAGAARMEEYRLSGELINANLWQLKKGVEQVELPNYYDENGGTMTIQLDIQLTPSQNAQRYYKKYQKARSARETAAEQRQKTLAELDFLESCALDVENSTDESDLEEVRAELIRQGYAKKVTSRRQQRVLPKSRPARFLSRDGILIEVGKNAAQNDRLTTGARPDEWWLHVKDMPGSHVIVRTEGELPERTYEDALILAVWFSKGKESSGVPVDCTRRRFVKKPAGAAPGKVIYTHQHTSYVTVEQKDFEAIQKLED